MEQPISDFLERYRKGTGYTYRSGILHFLDFIAGERMRAGNSSGDSFKRYEQFAAEYLKGDRDKPRDFFRFVKNMDEQKVPPKTADSRYVSVVEWLKFHDVVIPEKIMKDARRMKPKGGRRTNFDYFDKDAIRQILTHGDVRFRALVLVLASSGIRIGEALALRWDNLNVPDRAKYPDKPASLYVEVSKTGNSRLVFISREAEQALEEWRKVLPAYRERAMIKSSNFKKKWQHSSDAIFPISDTHVYEIWDKALQDAGRMNKDQRTGRTRLNIHRLRNFFSVQVASAVGQQVSEYLLGHVDGYGNAYNGRNESDWEKEYRKAEPSLTISEIALPSRELDLLRQENDELRGLIKELRANFGYLITEVQEQRGFLKSRGIPVGEHEPAKPLSEWVRQGVIKPAMAPNKTAVRK